MTCLRLQSQYSSLLAAPATLAQVSKQKLATFGSNLKLGDESNEGEHLLEQSLKIKMTVQKVPESPNPLPQAPNFLGGSISLASRARPSQHPTVKASN